VTGEVTFSLDEMTGIQALERTMPDIPMKPGDCVKREFEYIRHGTQTLIASFAESFRSGSPTMETTQANVATGAIALATVGDPRTEQDLEAHVSKLIDNSPDRFMESKSHTGEGCHS
jgi:hypothetical protein